MHIGKEIQKELKSQKKTVVWFAKELAYTRVNIYKIFEKSSIDTILLMRISRILNHDFFHKFSEEISSVGDKT